MRKKGIGKRVLPLILSLGMVLGSYYGGFSHPIRVAAEENQEKKVEKNILKGIISTTNAETKMQGADFTVPGVIMKNKDKATDGIKTEGMDRKENNTIILAGAENGSKPNNGLADWKPVYLQYDFGSEQDVSKIDIYRRPYLNPLACSKFLDVKVELSTDENFKEENTKVVFEKQDVQETKATRGRAQTIDVKAANQGKTVRARYLRVWQRGHFIANDNGNWSGYSSECLFTEIEVKALVDKGEVPPEEEKPKAVNIASGKIPFVRGLEPENIEAITDGKTDGKYAVHKTLGSGELEFAYKNRYSFENIKLVLEPGEYDSISVDILYSPKSQYKTNVFRENGFNVEGPIEIDVQDKFLYPVNGKCVRFTIQRKGNLPTKYEEVELWATGSSFDESKPEYIEPQSKYTKLVWNDEFNEDTVNEKKWNIIDGMANHGAIYNKQAVSIVKKDGNGYLNINTKNYGSTEALIAAVNYDKYQNQVLDTRKVTWSSGRLESKNKFSFQYGRIAVRAKVNDSKGIWPAIWMLCQDETGHDEIDILEYLGQNEYEAWTTNHVGILGRSASYKASHGVATEHWEAYSQDFHVYEAEWSPDEIKFYIDGKQVHRTTMGKDDGRDGMHTRPMFPILETQVGDGWVGDVDYNRQQTKQDSNYLIDYVRVYQEDKQNIVRFDDLQTLQPTSGKGYLVTPFSHTDGLVQVSNGRENYEDKNNFFYGGQPRYEDSRLYVKKDVTEPQGLVYKIPDVLDVHLTAYYQTVVGEKWCTDTRHVQKEGISIRERLVDNAKLDFNIYTSKDNKEYTKFDGVKVVENYPEIHPSYARVTFDAYGLPAGTQYVKVEFPDYAGKRYKELNREEKAVLNTDVQLAKVTFLQKYQEDVDLNKTDSDIKNEKPEKENVPSQDGGYVYEPITENSGSENLPEKSEKKEEKQERVVFDEKIEEKNESNSKEGLQIVKAKKNGNALLSVEKMKNALDSEQKILIKKGRNQIELNISVLKELSEKDKDVRISIKKVSSAKLKLKQKNKAAFKIKIGKKKKLKHKITITLPFKKKGKGKMKVYVLEDGGKLKEVKRVTYDEAKERVSFKTDIISTIVVGN